MASLPHLANMNTAIQSYLDDLLWETGAAEADTAEAGLAGTGAAGIDAAEAQERAEAEAWAQDQAHTETEAKAERQAEQARADARADAGAQAEARSQVQAAPLTDSRAEEAPEAAEQPAVAATPTWAEGRFQAMFFDVAGMQLVVALTELHSVLPCSAISIGRIPGQPHWQLGVFRHRDHHVRVLDTSGLLGRYTGSGPTHVLLVADGDWALACHGIGDVLSLTAAGIRWRAPNPNPYQGAGPWLAGTVVDNLCTIIDPLNLVQSLQNA